MALSYTHLPLLLISIACVLGVGMASRNFPMNPENWNPGFNYTGNNNFTTGPYNWNSGFNYTGNNNNNFTMPPYNWNSGFNYTGNNNFTMPPYNWNSGFNYTGNNNFTMPPYNWNSGFNYTGNNNFTAGTGFNYTGWPFRHPNTTHESRKIIIGGSENWHFGYNYSDWATKNAPFFYNDTLVFKYDPPSSNNTHPHSVYLLPNLKSFIRCDLRRGKRVARTSEGGGNGFEYVLNKSRPYFFACGESNGFHCRSGMKFSVMPMLRWY